MKTLFGSNGEGGVGETLHAPGEKMREEPLMHNREETEVLLRYTQERLALILEGVELGLFDIDLQSGLGLVDHYYLDMLGYTAADAPVFDSKQWQSFIHPDDWERVVRHFQNTLRGRRESMEIEYRMHHKSGDWIWVLSRGRVVRFDDQGKPSRYAGTHLNITARKQAEEALRLSEERLRLIADNMTDLVLMMDKDLTIRYASPSIKAITGFPMEDRLGRSAMELVHPDDLPRLEHLSKKLFGPSGSHRVEYRLRHAEGHYIWLETTASILLGEDKAFAGAVVNIRDITGRKLLEAELQRTLDEMERRVRERTAELEEANTALRVLLNRRGEDQADMEERLQRNINELIFPMINILRDGDLQQDRTRNCLKLLEDNLTEITSPFLNNLSTVYTSLTPQEVRIARMIRDGQSSKQMAELLGVGRVTIEKHRNNIRKKLGLVHGKINLRSFLLSIP